MLNRVCPSEQAVVFVLMLQDGITLDRLGYVERIFNLVIIAQQYDTAISLFNEHQKLGVMLY